MQPLPTSRDGSVRRRVMEHVVHLADRPALRVVAKRVSIGIESIGPTLSEAFGEVYAIIGAAEAVPAGPPFVIYHSMP
jgi:hypothetical protein